MKKFPLLVFAAIVAAFLVACGPPPANNTPTNTNANTTKPTAAAPAASDLQALDQKANDAYFKGDSAFFETFLSDKYGSNGGGKHQSKADVVKFIAGVKCDMKGDFKLEDPQMSKIDDDTYVFSYKGTFDGTCNDGPGGKTEKIPSPIRAATVFVRNGSNWQAAWHGETKLMESKADAKPDAKSDAKDAKKDDAKAADTKKEEPKADAKKEEPKKDDAKKAEPKKDDAKKDDKAASSAPAASTEPAKPDANTDALVKTELGGWKAWKDHDAKALDDLAAKNLAAVDPGGKWFGTRADVLKSWDGSNCKDVKNVDVKNGFAWALSPTVEVLTFDATADGSCDGQKNGPMDGASVYIKEGDNWKIAFGFLHPKEKM